MQTRLVNYKVTAIRCNPSFDDMDVAIAESEEWESILLRGENVRARDLKGAYLTAPVTITVHGKEYKTDVKVPLDANDHVYCRVNLWDCSRAQMEEATVRRAAVLEAAHALHRRRDRLAQMAEEQVQRMFGDVEAPA